MLSVLEYICRSDQLHVSRLFRKGVACCRQTKWPSEKVVLSVTSNGKTVQRKDNKNFGHKQTSSKKMFICLSLNVQDGRTPP